MLNKTVNQGLFYSTVEDLNYHYVELASPPKSDICSASNNINQNVQIVAGGGVKDKCIVFEGLNSSKKRFSIANCRSILHFIPPKRTER